MAFAYPDMLATIQDRQWALADIDWDAPGAELITAEQRPRLAAFMADLVWIEHVGARGFAALTRKAPPGALREIYRYFHAEEQKHANAELALMRRWGMLPDDEMPVPNNNIRLVIEWLDRYADDLSLPVLGTVIPSLETALDGALVRFLLDEVEDPICHQVFRHINSDESRHLAVGFQVLEQLGAGPVRRLAIETAGLALRPSFALGAVLYAPLLSRMAANIVALGLDEDKLWNAVRRYETLGDRRPAIRRVPLYHVVRYHARMTIHRVQPMQLATDVLNAGIDRIPGRLFGAPPSWSRELTYEPVAK
ncbi:reductase [Nocardia vermiculata]|uniref:Ferritin-like domain-containing protein n=1 Tax=Nocardia vermiculata TaxID=257274 RepID=A0A846XU34_9NOCA|nr:reductase [Nocardia vermiculata]NKY50623.1 ferritin-like domain-containing protein [Nocardia vermiculata]